MPTQPSREVYTPSSLNRLVRDLLEDALPLIWIEGEISDFRQPSSGHLYFSLKDARAQIRCAMFRSAASRLPFRPANGQHVLLRGRIGLYEARGDFQLIAEHMEDAGEGALRREFELLKARLEAEGLFDAARKRPLPAMPRRIGVLSSAGGAAVRDVISVIGRRFPLAEVELLPVPVQGKEAAAAIIAMLERVGRSGRHDVLLLTRGGGSIEDLFAFNDEALARAIAASPVPLVSAVGHEIDCTLADFAADLRAATPSVASELLVPDQRELLQRLAHRRERITAQTERRLHALAQRLDHLQARLRAQRPQQRLAHGSVRLQQLRHRLWRCQPTVATRERLRGAARSLEVQNPQAALRAHKKHNAALGSRLETNMRRYSERRRDRMRGVNRALHAVSPLATLQRGYAVLFDADGKVLRSAASIQPDARITARLADGSLQLRNIGQDNAG